MTSLHADAKISILSMRDTGPAPEAALARDIIKRGLIASPILLAVSGAFWGLNGAYSCAYALAIVFGNFALAAALVAYTARISYALMMASMMFGYLLRLALVAAAVFVVRNLGWVDSAWFDNYFGPSWSFILGVAICFFVARIPRAEAKKAS
ncbi:MAG: hypothetical protein EB035_06480 [Actinobacteria bacterium]|nr:hypothetical protein [Actinomycetota bacterium]